MTMLRRGLAASLALCLLAGTALAQSADPARTLVVAVPSDAVGLEPGTNRAEPIGSEVILNVFDTLVAWTAPDFAALEGRLATRWTVSPDGRIFDFELRDGVRFHDGTVFDAAAVKVSLERTRAMNPFAQASFNLIESIAVESPRAVRIVLKEPYPAFLSILAQPQSAIVSPAALARHGDQFPNNPVGTGPFMFRTRQADTNIVLDANPGYFRGAPKVDRLVYRIIPNASTRRLELENGGVDILQQAGQLAAIPAETIQALRNNRNVAIIEVPSQIIRQLEFNNKKTTGPVADLRVRRAITHAIDYDGLLQGVFGNTADRVYGPLTSNSWAFNPKIRDLAPKYDPALARRLLAEAGIRPGSLTLPLYTFQGALWGAVATFVQANLADIGINVTIQQTEFPALRALHTSGNFDLALDGRQPWYNDPDAHITIGYLSSLADTAMTFRFPKDDALDASILKAQQTVSMDERRALYFKLQEDILARAPGAYLFSPKLIVFARANVRGLVINSAPPLTEYWSVAKQ
jgi:peptide/nickel transport system substrate-binding protein